MSGFATLENDKEEKLGDSPPGPFTEPYGVQN